MSDLMYNYGVDLFADETNTDYSGDLFAVPDKPKNEYSEDLFAIPEQEVNLPTHNQGEIFSNEDLFSEINVSSSNDDLFAEEIIPSEDSFQQDLFTENNLYTNKDEENIIEESNEEDKTDIFSTEQISKDNKVSKEEINVEEQSLTDNKEITSESDIKDLSKEEIKIEEQSLTDNKEIISENNTEEDSFDDFWTFTPDSDSTIKKDEPLSSEEVELSGGVVGFLCSFFMLFLFFVTLILSNKEQTYASTISLDVFYIISPIALVINGVSFKSLWGKIGGILFIGVIILQLIQGAIA